MASTVVWPRFLSPGHLVTLILRQKSPAAALELFTSAPVIYPNTYRHTPAVLSALLHILSPDHLPSFLPHLRSFLLAAPASRDLDPLLSRAIRSLSATGAHSDALSLFRLLPLSSITSWPQSFHSILNVFLSNRDFHTARQLLDELSQRGDARLNLQSLNLIIHTLCRLGRVDLAVEVFMELKEQDCSPDRDTYRILMRGLCESGRLDDGIHLLYSMLWRITQKGCDGDVSVYRMLLEALCADGRVREAEHVLGKVLMKGLRGPGPRRSFRKVELQGLGGLQEMKRKIDEALVVRGVRSSQTYATMIGDLYEEGKIVQADKLFDEMIKRRFWPTVDIFERKIAALCRDGRVEDGSRVLEVEMKENGCAPSSRGCELVMEGFCKAGKAKNALECLDRMERKFVSVARKESFEILVDGLLREGQVLRAADLLERMTRKRYYAGKKIYGGVIRGLCSVGRRYDAVLWLEEMVSQAKVPNACVWSSLVSMACVDYDKANIVSRLDLLMDG